ncbi:uncharacterized protein I303_107758 [Kwoniella dejecticola CBS 10117]|uniref:Uncharacterized protein n=1 Tax=Kwoniella dejecticola CBS 10117 TaxID=1296121 RepID=A0A1A5ZVL7_9TREE|nr:uncharacterized protein I303_07763 [Kwoniella dejecticola CBS 10117]OBR81853.1 hypothetical protein I303_07763 [Kwoniella dejecticola CBS 10117]
MFVRNEDAGSNDGALTTSQMSEAVSQTIDTFEILIENLKVQISSLASSSLFTSNGDVGPGDGTMNVAFETLSDLSNCMGDLRSYTQKPDLDITARARASNTANNNTNTDSSASARTNSNSNSDTGIDWGLTTTIPPLASSSDSKSGSKETPNTSSPKPTQHRADVRGYGQISESDFGFVNFDWDTNIRTISNTNVGPRGSSVVNDDVPGQQSLSDDVNLSFDPLFLLDDFNGGDNSHNPHLIGQGSETSSETLEGDSAMNSVTD